jgi:hypothetical protein
MANYSPASSMTRPIAPVSKRTVLNAKGRRFVRQATVVTVAVVAAISFFSGQAATAGSEQVKARARAYGSWLPRLLQTKTVATGSPRLLT